jgi:iron complex outermembrane recepter protein
MSNRNSGRTAAIRAVRSIAMLAAALSGLPPTAFAQQTGAKTQAQEDQPTLGEILVTAQRREQRLQDVGISVTALDAEALANRNITEATDIARAVPSLKMNAYSDAQVVYNIRGVSQNDYGDQQEPPVAVYQDDSYSSSINLASFPVFDLARVEVLRGPQGTLFGRNATGGAIQFVSKKPTKDFEGYGTVTVGSYHQLITEGAISGPLADTLQARLSVVRNTDDGYIKSLAPGVPDHGGNNHYALRGQLAWQPTSFTNVNLTLRYLRAPNERQAGQYSFEPACPNAQLQGGYLPRNVGCAFWGSPPGAAGSGYRNDSITPSRGGNPWASAETQNSYDDRRIFGSSLHVDADLESLHLVSITDYQHSNKFYIEGADASPDAGILFYQGSKLDQITQELRLSGLAGPHQWVAGVYGMYVDGHYTGSFADPFYGYDPTVSMMQRTTSYAAFAQDEWQFEEAWTLIGGLRYWRDQRVGGYFGTAPAVPGLSAPVTVIFDTGTVSPAGSRMTPADAKRTYSGLTARAQLDYKPQPNLLYYVSYNRGSKSGGFTFSTGTPYDPNGSLAVPRAFLEGIPFRPEVLNAYELGLKATLSRMLTANISAFHYQYTDYQAFTQYGPIQTVINMDAAENGFEAELNARPLAGLTLELGTSVLDSVVRNVTLPDGVTVQNHNLPQAPKFSGNALARYEFGIGNGTLGLQADMIYSGRSCFTVLCAPVEKERPYSVANARISYAAGGWEVAAFGNNLFERQYRLYAFDSSLFAGVVSGVYAKPRTWGVSATYRFGAARK